MNRTLPTAVVLAWGLVASGGHATEASHDPRNLVVMIQIENPTMGERRYGAGIVVDQNDVQTIIATASHNLREDGQLHGRLLPELKVQFRPWPGHFVPARVAPGKTDPLLDLAVLLIDGKDAPQVLGEYVGRGVLREQRLSPRGERGRVVGYGGGVPWSHELEPEPLTRTSETEIRIETPEIAPGQSGGGVFDENWSLVGMAVQADPPHAIARPISLILDQLRAWNFQIGLEGDRNARRRIARRELRERNVPWTSEALADALASVDVQILDLFTTAGVTQDLVLEALGVRRGERSVAEIFFSRSVGNDDAARWLHRLLEGGVDPNATIAGRHYERIGLLVEALRAGSVSAAVSLLEAGASPHPYQELLGSVYAVPQFLFPFEYLMDNRKLSAEAKQELARAYLAHGAVIPEIGDRGDGGTTSHQLRSIEKALGRGPEVLGTKLSSSPTLCKRPRTPICAAASERTGKDWCAFAERMPKRIRVRSGERPHLNIAELHVLHMLNVVDRQAYFVGRQVGVWKIPEFYLIEISNDERLWKVYGFTSPGWWEGSCEKNTGGPPQLQSCWRRIRMAYDPTAKTMRIGEGDYYLYDALTSCDAALR